MSEVTWTCHVCRRPIERASGFVAVGESDLRDRAARRKAWEAAHSGPIEGSLDATGSDWLSYPPPAHWRAYHFTCDPQPDSDDYSIAVERISTLRAVLGWTAHLLGKRWIAETDWADVLRELAGREEL